MRRRDVAFADGSRTGHLRALRCTADGAEFFRIWSIDLLLTLASLGLWSPWAKARQERYFCSNLWLVDSALEQRRSAGPLFVARAIRIVVTAAALMLVLGFLAGLLPAPGLAAALLALLLALPALVWLFLRLRWAGVGWRGIELSFRAVVGTAYARLLAPLLACGLWPILALAFGQALVPAAPVPCLLGVAIPAGLVFVPLLHQRLWCFFLDHLHLGSLPMRCGVRASQFYGIHLRALGLALAILAALALLVAAASVVIQGPAEARALATVLLRDPPSAELVAVGVAGAGLVWFMLVPYLQARVQNLVWGRTSVGPHRLISRLRVRRLWVVRTVNLLFVLATLGLFLPFATVRTARCRLQAVAIAVLGDLDRIRSVRGEVGAPAAP